jgi:hypothetical protein
MSLVDLVAELERQKNNSKDLIVDTSTVQAVPTSKDIALRVPETGEYPLTEFAHGQLAEKLKIPKRYYDRIRQTGKTELLAGNINAWMDEKDRRLFRITDGNIRAILSDRYRIMDNYDLVWLALEEFKQKETIEVHRADLTETHMYFKTVDRTLVAEIRDKDVVNGGLIIRNSEVGAGAFRVEPFILRQICTNGLIGEHSLQKVHIGRATTEVGFIDWSDETRKLSDQALWSAVRDVIRSSFDDKVFYEWVETAQRAIEVAIEVQPVRVIDTVATHLGITEDQKNNLLQHFIADKDYTQYGLVNAVTRTARDLSNVDEQVRLETSAGQILAMNDKNFEALVVA